MPNIHVYIDDSYWRNGEDCNQAAISTIEQCLSENKALFIIHFNNVSEDVIEEHKKTMLGTAEGPMAPIVALILKLGNGKSEKELKIENGTAYDKRFFTSRYPLDNYRGTIIFSKNEALSSLEKEYGYGIINSDCFNEQNILVLEKDKEIVKSDYTSNLKYGNSVVIVDRFALKDNMTIEKSLLPILQKIKSDTSITLTILSQFQYKKDEQRGNTLEEAFNKIVEMCPSQRNWKVEIYDVGEKYHDRFIITNNNYITIGGGFDSLKLLNLKLVGSKNTSMHKYLYPLFQKEISKEVKFYIKSIQNTINSVDRTKKKSNINNGASNYLTTNWI